LSSPSAGDSEAVLNDLLFDLLAVISKAVMKVDLAGQVKYLQSVYPVEHILKGVTSEIIRLKELKV